MKLRILLPWLTGLVLTACGGGSSDNSAQIAALTAQANEKEAQARALGADAPCNDNAQCSYLFFGPTTPACTGPNLLPLSAASPASASAQTLVEQQQSLAAQALALQQSNVLCPAGFLTPAPQCLASRCK